MNIDKKNPIQICIISIIASFILCIIVMLLTKPICIIQVNKKSGISFIYVPLLLLYSAIFSLIFGIIVFLFFTSNEQNDIKETYG